MLGVLQKIIIYPLIAFAKSKKQTIFDNSLESFSGMLRSSRTTNKNSRPDNCTVQGKFASLKEGEDSMPVETPRLAGVDLSWWTRRGHTCTVMQLSQFWSFLNLKKVHHSNTNKPATMSL